MRRTYGASYSGVIDGKRIAAQTETVRRYMLNRDWRTLFEIAGDLRIPESSVSAQLRHLRKPEFGGYVVEKRRRAPFSGTWEYKVRPAPTTFDADGQGLFL